MFEYVRYTYVLEHKVWAATTPTGHIGIGPDHKAALHALVDSLEAANPEPNPEPDPDPDPDPDPVATGFPYPTLLAITISISAALLLWHYTGGTP